MNCLFSPYLKYKLKFNKTTNSWKLKKIRQVVQMICTSSRKKTLT